VENLCHKLEVIHVLEAAPSVLLDESVKAVRPHIVCCIVTGISFVHHTLKKFIQLQVILNTVNPCLTDLTAQGGWVGKVDKSVVTGVLSPLRSVQILRDQILHSGAKYFE
jgi:hypothetical protein